MKNILISLATLLFIQYVSAQKIATKKIKQDPFYYDNFIFVENGEESFIISKFKTTNKDYLCFLQWTYRVYGNDYPSVYTEMQPDTIKYPDLFNPEKSNDAVKGISQKQAQSFCQWRSDRLNEGILIREGILKKNFNQINEDNFTTESYLCFQYEGMVKNDVIDIKTHKARTIIHTDYFLLPSFYIASKEELKICDSLMKFTNLKTPKRIESDLDWWFKNEFEISKQSSFKSPMELYQSKIQSGKLSNIKKYIKTLQKELANKVIDYNPSGVLVSEKDYRTYKLHHLDTQMRYYPILCDKLSNPFDTKLSSLENKNNLGKMSFSYFADNFDGKPICIYTSEFEDHSTANISETGFYYAMNVPYRIFMEIQKNALNFGKAYKY